MTDESSAMTDYVSVSLQELSAQLAAETSRAAAAVAASDAAAAAQAAAQRDLAAAQATIKSVQNLQVRVTKWHSKQFACTCSTGLSSHGSSRCCDLSLAPGRAVVLMTAPGTASLIESCVIQFACWSCE
jgi:hypothetical protein